MRTQAISTGLNFGLTSGVITTLGLIVGLHSGTNSMLAIIGGIITIAIADSMSDALGIHISKESDPNAKKADIWIATITTLVAKMLMALSFVLPMLFLDLTQAIIASVIWGMTVIALLSYWLAKKAGENPIFVLAEHLGITIIVILTTHSVGDWIAVKFA
ncbi:MAG: hypothetical protein OEY38_13425 [Gammaproteobacteria bacterium]|nr:hypothetical protein [Gammaproteobacteria bacterium]